LNFQRRASVLFNMKGIWVIGRLRLMAFAGLLAIPAVGPVLMENALHVPPVARNKPEPKLAEAATRGIGDWFPAEVTPADGVVLRAWLFRPLAANGRAVILLHGVADTRAGVLAHARMLLQHGYTVLAPDSRGHGESGGTLITYGLREAEDVHRWADWLEAREHPQGLYGLGESMGAAILLQALPREPRFRAVVAECSFYDLRHVAFSRLAEGSGINPGIANWLFFPTVESAFLYAVFATTCTSRKLHPLERSAKQPVRSCSSMDRTTATSRRNNPTCWPCSGRNRPPCGASPAPDMSKPSAKNPPNSRAAYSNGLNPTVKHGGATLQFLHPGVNCSIGQAKV
jgi:pimeloyl-ACP methyl ester carboxylesterase